MLFDISKSSIYLQFAIIVELTSLIFGVVRTRIVSHMPFLTTQRTRCRYPLSTFRCSSFRFRTGCRFGLSLISLYSLAVGLCTKFDWAIVGILIWLSIFEIFSQLEKLSIVGIAFISDTECAGGLVFGRQVLAHFFRDFFTIELYVKHFSFFFVPT